MPEFEEGTSVNLRATFQDPVTLAYVDPDTVTAVITDPLGVALTYIYGTDPELQREAAGHYLVEVSASALGTWIYRFQTTGTYQGANDGTFYVF